MPGEQVETEWQLWARYFGRRAQEIETMKWLYLLFFPRRTTLAQIIAAADASAESYAGKVLDERRVGTSR